uniref:Uncharacterized protein n=1 Tax=Anguilla anguilla TaxID=7936 RepID=A0A0E9X6C9_ANGAN
MVLISTGNQGNLYVLCAVGLAQVHIYIKLQFSLKYFMHDYEYCNQGNHSISCDNLVMHLGLKIICILMKFGESCSVSVLNFSAMFENAALSTM